MHIRPFSSSTIRTSNNYNINLFYPFHIPPMIWYTFSTNWQLWARCQLVEKVYQIIGGMWNVEWVKKIDIVVVWSSNGWGTKGPYMHPNQRLNLIQKWCINGTIHVIFIWQSMPQHIIQKAKHVEGEYLTRLATRRAWITRHSLQTLIGSWRMTEKNLG